MQIMTKKIGIVYTPVHGGGWSSWWDPAMALDQELAHAIEAGASSNELEEIAAKNWPDYYIGTIECAKVEWVDEGTLFRITDYDGCESIEYPADYYWQVAKA